MSGAGGQAEQDGLLAVGDLVVAVDGARALPVVVHPDRDPVVGARRRRRPRADRRHARGHAHGAARVDEQAKRLEAAESALLLSDERRARAEGRVAGGRREAHRALRRGVGGLRCGLHVSAFGRGDLLGCVKGQSMVLFAAS